MVKVRVAGLKVYTSKGRTYVYHRATSRRVTASPGTPEFFAEVAALDALSKPPPTERPGTLGAIITAYRGATHYHTDLAPRTRADYARVLEWCRAGADMPLALIDRPFVVRLRDKAREAREARGRRFGMCLGLRKGEALRAPVSAHDATTGTLNIITAKTRRRVSVVAPADVRAAIGDRPRCDATTLCVSSRGAPWTESGFRASFFGLVRRLEAEGRVGPGLTFHGLRHTVGTTPRELGYDTRDVLGQATVQIAEHYSSSADLTEKVGAAVHHLDRACKGRKRPAAKPRPVRQSAEKLNDFGPS